MAVPRSNPSRHDAVPAATDPGTLAFLGRNIRVMAQRYETALRHSLGEPDESQQQRREEIPREAFRLAVADLATTMRKHIRSLIHAVESQGKAAEERLRAAASAEDAEMESSLAGITHGSFRLVSTELFDMLGQQTDVRFGTLRFRTSPLFAPDAHATAPGLTPGLTPVELTSVELDLNTSFFVAGSNETPHSFTIPESPSLRNRGILSRRAVDGGAFPAYDSWLLFTFVGSGYVKVEVPIEMCADVYGGSLRGRELEEVTFWGEFVEDWPPEA